MEDTAHSHVLAMECGDPGEEYIITGESHTMVDIFDLAEEITGVSAPRAVSPAVFGALARIMAVAEHIVTPPEGFEAERLRMLAGSNLVVDNSKAKRELGIEHRPLEEGLREYLDWEMEQLGMQRWPRAENRVVTMNSASLFSTRFLPEFV